MSADASPQVRNDGWGFVEVEGLGRPRDEGTQQPSCLGDLGGQALDPPADVAELLEHGADVVVLSRGRELRLETASETLSLLAARQVDVVRDETGAAIGEYNRLAAAGRRVGALLHSTC